MPIEDGIRYDGYWKYQEALEKGQFKNGSIFDGWYKVDGSMNYPDNWGAIPGTEEVVSLGNNGVIEVGRYGTPGSSSAYVTETGVTADRLALPPNTNLNEYIRYKINGSISKVERAVVAPWVGDKGLGIQYKLPKPINWYVERGILIPE